MRRKNSKQLRHLSRIHTLNIADHKAFVHMLVYVKIVIFKSIIIKFKNIEGK